MRSPVALLICVALACAAGAGAQQHDPLEQPAARLPPAALITSDAAPRAQRLARGPASAAAAAAAARPLAAPPADDDSDKALADALVELARAFKATFGPLKKAFEPVKAAVTDVSANLRNGTLSKPLQRSAEQIGGVVGEKALIAGEKASIASRKALRKVKSGVGIGAKATSALLLKAANASAVLLTKADSELQQLLSKIENGTEGEVEAAAARPRAAPPSAPLSAGDLLAS